jgi:hypothetical protein
MGKIYDFILKISAARCQSQIEYMKRLRPGLWETVIEDVPVDEKKKTTRSMSQFDPLKSQI